MKAVLPALLWATIMGVVNAQLTWPSQFDELEDLMFQAYGYRSTGLMALVTPCSYSIFGPGRNTAAEWVRAGFHDMSTGNIYNPPESSGGLDASLMFELNSGENIGAGFATTFATYGEFYSTRTSVADMIALGVYAGVRTCGGPPVPIRPGRIDATAAGPLGVPQPQNSIGTFENQFLRSGFNYSDMIAMTACGHSLGGVHAEDFSNIVTPGTVANNYQLFDGTFEFDSNVAEDYISNNSTDALVVGPATSSGRASDAAVFGDRNDNNATITALANPATFRTSCASILQRMIERVPGTVTLADPLQPYEVKPTALQLTLLSGGVSITFSGEIRVRTTVRSADQIASVQLVYVDRNGESSCGSCTIETEVAGTGSGFDDTFTFYSFSSDLSSNTSISSFNVHITLASGTTEVHDNNGGGFPIQDSIFFQAPQSCLGTTTDANGNKAMTVVAAVRNSVTTVPSVVVAIKTPRAKVPVPALNITSVTMSKGAAIGPYNIYTGSYSIPAANSLNSTFNVTIGTGPTSVVDAFKLTGNLSSVCGTLGTSVPSTTTTSKTSSRTTVSTTVSTTIKTTSSSASVTPTGPATKPTVGAYTYQGCYTEGDGVRALSGASFFDYDNMTLEKCATNCAGYTYFGVEYSGECYCGNTLATSSVPAANQGDCSFTCPGDSSEFCGAGNRLDMYKLSSAVSSTSSSTSSATKTTTTQKPTTITTTTTKSTISTTKATTTSSASASPTLGIVKSVGPWNYAGCYTEGTNTRALGAAFYPSDTQTIESCVASCKGYLYAGAEYGRECWCGNSFGQGAVLTSDSDCSMTCVGDQYEYCGAGNRLSVYVMNGTGSSSSSSSTSLSSTSSKLTTSSSKSTTLSTTKATTATTSTTQSASTTQTGPAIKPTIGSYTYYGCQTEANGIRALSSTSFASDSMTLEICEEFCQGYTYWGAEYGRECYCGNSWNTGSIAAPDSDCSFPCANNTLEYCGAGNRLSAYVLKA
ncbi:heme peroxidase [Xylogone sp. PMI_703]|nr:heme peroxidase [Xylogone sp. PMI_703]